MSELNVKTTDLVYAYFDSFVNSNINCVGKVVDGTIKLVDKKKGIVIVDAGLKNEGVIPIREFANRNGDKELNVGDTVKVYVIKNDDKNSYLLSRENALKEESRLKVKEAFENDEVIEGIPFAKVKSGLSVDFDGFIAFLPGSQIDEGNVTDISNIIGKKQQFKVISFDDKNVVVSRKMVISDSYKDKREAFYATASEGMVVEGKVRNITDYGVFIDLGFGVDALLHVGDIVWEKITHPSEVLTIGQEVKAKIIKLDKENDKIAVSMKVLTENSWLKNIKGIEVGQKINGRITSIANYGIFVELSSNVEGLIHISELIWSGNAMEEIKKYNVGDKVDVLVIDIDAEKQRISLSVRRLLKNPIKEFADTNKVGAQFEATITKIVDYGFFVSVGEVEGFVSLENLAWMPDVDILSRYKVGDAIKVSYVSVDDKFIKLAFGVKQLTENPFEKYKDMFAVGKNVSCKVVELKPDRIVVEVVDGVYTSIKKANLSREKEDQRIDRFTVGNIVDAKIVAFDLDKKKFVLSIKELEDEKYNEIVGKYGSDNSGASIADVLGVALDKFENNKK